MSKREIFNKVNKKSNKNERIALSCEKDDLKKFHRHRLLAFRWYEDNY
ncbi:MAG: hypothetical protein ACTSQP_15660 [Promethearchaeota archaeon]